MENFIHIITQPDNIAIVLMLIAVTFCSAAAFREMRINDRFIREGKPEKIYQRMTKQ